MKILFIGTSEFALNPLKKLLDNNFNIIAVITQQDKPKGRGRKITFSPVKEFSVKNKLPILQPSNINSEEIRDFIKKNNIDLGIVISYGQIISREIFSLPKYNMINIHPSLLPKYRGPSPLQSALLNGDTETGVSIIEINEDMDAGDILIQKKIEIDIDDDFFTLQEKTSTLGANLLVECLNKLQNNEINYIKQDEKKASYCKIIKKDDGLINWNDTAFNIHNKVRAFIKWPVAYTYFNNQVLKIYKTKLINKIFNNTSSGEVIKFSKKAMGIICGDGNVLEILKLQLQGKKILETSQFLNGIKIKTGDRLG